MKYIWFGIFVVLLFVCAGEGSAQGRWQMPREEGGRPERLEKFRKMRLIEVLKLDEEEAVRFFAKQSFHEDKIHDLMKTRNETLDLVEKLVQDKGDLKELGKAADRMKLTDSEIFSERQRYQDELRQFLTAVQFGKFIVFERDFGRQVRDAMQEMRQGHRTPPGGDE